EHRDSAGRGGERSDRPRPTPLWCRRAKATGQGATTASARSRRPAATRFPASASPPSGAREPTLLDPERLDLGLDARSGLVSVFRGLREELQDDGGDRLGNPLRARAGWRRLPRDVAMDQL